MFDKNTCFGAASEVRQTQPMWYVEVNESSDVFDSSSTLLVLFFFRNKLCPYPIVDEKLLVIPLVL